MSSTIANELSQAGQNVRKYYQKRLPSDSSKDYYYMHRNTPNNETIIVEYGFLDSTEDDVTQLKNDLETLAEAVVKGLATYLGVKYTAPSQEGYYTVVSGDTLWSIARKNNTTVNELKSLNNLTSNALSVGQVLKLPTTTINQTTYTVQKGDNLYKIANMYGITVDELKYANNLSSNLLSIGQVLTIPTTTNNSPSSTTTYTVQKGDSLYKIANMYGITVDELKQTNNLSSNILSIGQILEIPSKEQYTTYTVTSGDTLYSIARKYNTTVAKLTNLNNLATSNLSIGQKLLIPN